MEKEPAAKGPSALGEAVAAGSTTFRWRAISEEAGHYWEEMLSL
jgi:hypothetical protein